MADAQSTIWEFLKTFSNKFSISDLVNGNERRGNGAKTRKNVTYNRLQTHDKGDFLSSSNPHLLDIVGGGKEPSSTEKDDKLGHNKSHATIATTKGRFLSSNSLKGSSSRGGNMSFSATTNSNNSKEDGGGGGLTARKFTFPSRVATYQEDDADGETDLDKNKKKNHRFGHNHNHHHHHHQDHPEDSDDSNWIECGDDDDDEDDGNESDFAAEDEENNRRCGYCGCEKKYAITTNKFLE